MIVKLQNFVTLYYCNEYYNCKFSVKGVFFFLFAHLDVSSQMELQQKMKYDQKRLEKG